MDLHPSLTAESPLIPASEFPASHATVRKPTPSRFKEFFTAFIAIFLAEIGDKTQLATLLMAAESHSPWVVFAGAAAALVATSLVGVLLGQWLARHLSEERLQTITGAGMLLIAVLLLWDMVHVG
ncbi:MAG TPA: TMEM165/GDT1 family protein [Stenomitos sp.]